MKLKNMELIGVRGFKKLNLNFINPQTNEPNKNIVLIGPNGSGKTTVLKSIVHCLTTWNYYYGGEKMEKKDINVGSDEFSITLHMQYNDIEKKTLLNTISKKDIEGYSTITTIKQRETLEEDIDVNGDDYLQPTKKTIYKDYILIHEKAERDSYIEFRKNVMSNVNKENLVFYFDALRFLPTEYLSGPNAIELPSNNRSNMLGNSISYDNNKNIYRYVFVKQWLINMDFRHLKNSNFDLIYKRVIDSINQLIAPTKFYKISEKGEILFQTKTGVVSIEQLSDGFKNIFIILGEILYRFETSSNIADINEMFNKEAIVLIDEIDCHLHPEWQVNLIPSLNKLFPNIQIIATTHSPFIVDSLQPNEIIKLGGEEN